MDTEQTFERFLSEIAVSSGWTMFLYGLAAIAFVLWLFVMYCWFQSSAKFPMPRKSILTFDEIVHYWEDTLNEKWRAECIFRVYRTQPYPNPQPSYWMFKGECPWYEEVNLQTGTRERRLLNSIESIKPASFTLRIDRHWETLPGVEHKKEICIANLELK